MVESMVFFRDWPSDKWCSIERLSKSLEIDFFIARICDFRLWNPGGEVVWEALSVSPSEARSKSWFIKNELSDPRSNEAVARGYILQVLIMSCFHQFEWETLIRPFDGRKLHTKGWIAFHATIPLCQKWHLKAVNGQALPMSVLFIRCDGMKRDRITRVNSNERNTSQNFTTHWTVWVQIDIRKRK